MGIKNRIYRNYLDERQRNTVKYGGITTFRGIFDPSDVQGFERRQKHGTENILKYIEEKHLLGYALAYVLLFVLHAVTDVNIWAHIVLNAFAFGAIGVSTMMQWGLVGETIDYNEYLTGKRTEGSIYGTFNMLRRIGQALGTSTSVAVLGWIGYDVVAANAGLAQNASTIFGIKVMCVLVPALFALGSWAAFRFVWNITPEIRANISGAQSAKNR